MIAVWQVVPPAAFEGGLCQKIERTKLVAGHLRPWLPDSCLLGKPCYISQCLSRLLKVGLPLPPPLRALRLMT